MTCHENKENISFKKPFCFSIERPLVHSSPINLSMKRSNILLPELKVYEEVDSVLHLKRLSAFVKPLKFPFPDTIATSPKGFKAFKRQLAN